MSRWSSSSTTASVTSPWRESRSWQMTHAHCWRTPAAPRPWTSGDGGQPGKPPETRDSTSAGCSPGEPSPAAIRTTASDPRSGRAIPRRITERAVRRREPVEPLDARWQQHRFVRLARVCQHGCEREPRFGQAHQRLGSASMTVAARSPVSGVLRVDPRCVRVQPVAFSSPRSRAASWPPPAPRTLSAIGSGFGRANLPSTARPSHHQIIATVGARAV